MKPLIIDYIDLILPKRMSDYNANLIEKKFKELKDICKNKNIKLIVNNKKFNLKEKQND